ncbi:putative cytosolic NADP isocitrate dehydrogenase, partial [Tanacetum coccineum]
MRNIIMTMPNIQLNSKFVNNMSPEWDRFMTAVKLNKGTVFREPILCKQTSPNWYQLGQSQYALEDMLLVIIPEGGGEITDLEVYNFTGARGVALSMYNTDEVCPDGKTIEAEAWHCDTSLQGADSHSLWKEFANKIGDYVDKYVKAMEKVKLKKGLECAMKISGEGNAYLQ